MISGEMQPSHKRANLNCNRFTKQIISKSLFSFVSQLSFIVDDPQKTTTKKKRQVCLQINAFH